MIKKTGRKRIKLVAVDDRTKLALTTKLTEAVNSDSIIYSDCWKAYNGLDSSFVDNKTVNHSRHFKDPLTGIHTNTIEGSWAGIKMHVPLRGRTKTEINLYLVRYMLLKNEDGHPLDRIIKYLFYLFSFCTLSLL